MPKWPVCPSLGLISQPSLHHVPAITTRLSAPLRTFHISAARNDEAPSAPPRRSDRAAAAARQITRLPAARSSGNVIQPRGKGLANASFKGGRTLSPNAELKISRYHAPQKTITPTKQPGKLIAPARRPPTSTRPFTPRGPASGPRAGGAGGKGPAAGGRRGARNDRQKRTKDNADNNGGREYPWADGKFNEKSLSDTQVEYLLEGQFAHRREQYYTPKTPDNVEDLLREAASVATPSGPSATGSHLILQQALHNVRLNARVSEEERKKVEIAVFEGRYDIKSAESKTQEDKLLNETARQLQLSAKYPAQGMDKFLATMKSLMPPQMSQPRK